MLKVTLVTLVTTVVVKVKEDKNQNWKVQVNNQ